MTKTIHIDLTGCFVDLITLIVLMGIASAIGTVIVGVAIYALASNGWIAW